MKSTSKKTASHTSTIIISNDEFAHRAAQAIAKSDFIKDAPIEIATSLIVLSSLILVEVENELFGGGKEK